MSYSALGAGLPLFFAPLSPPPPPPADGTNTGTKSGPGDVVSLLAAIRSLEARLKTKRDALELQLSAARESLAKVDADLARVAIQLAAATATTRPLLDLQRRTLLQRKSSISQNMLRARGEAMVEIREIETGLEVKRGQLATLQAAQAESERQRQQQAQIQAQQAQLQTQQDQVRREQEALARARQEMEAQRAQSAPPLAPESMLRIGDRDLIPPEGEPAAHEPLISAPRPWYKSPIAIAAGVAGVVGLLAWRRKS